MRVIAWLAALSLSFVCPAIAAAQGSERMSESSTAVNRAMIQRAFDDWSAGEGDVFSLLAENATWRIMGSDPQIARTHHSREALLDAAAKPLAARLKGPLKPIVRRIWADGDEVIVFWDGEGDVYDGTKYRTPILGS